MSHSSLRAVGVLGLAGLLLAGCSNPERDKARHLERGDQYVAEKQDAFAVVEYGSAIRIDPLFGEAHRKLAETYERMGNLRAAFPAYIRAADALPDNRDLQLKAAGLLLRAGRFDDAKARVVALLAKNPDDVDALLLHASALAALRDPASAIAEIEEALKISPDSSQAYLSLGTFRMQGGEAKEAEAAFRRAVALEPAGVAPKLALANFLWAAGRVPEAEAAIKEALTINAQHLLANRMLGTLYLATRRVEEAEQPLKVIADVSTSPAAQLQLADYYASVGRPADATGVLTPLSANQATFVDAEMRLAAIDYRAGRLPEAHKRLDGVLARVPNNSSVLATKARWLTAEGKLDEALERAKAAVAADQQSASAHFALAAVYDRRLDVTNAITSYNEVLRLNPRAVAAQVELSRLSLSTGDRKGAVEFAERARQAEPSSLEARVALARSLIAAGNLTRAQTEVAALLQAAPNAAVVHAVHGMLLASQKNPGAARTAFDRSLQLSPGFLEALGGLTVLDLQAKNPAQAIARLEAEIAREPRAQLLALLARAQVAGGNQAGAEQALRRAVALDPLFQPGYAMLAQLYARQGRLEEARVEFEGIASRDPSATGARTMVGLLLEAQGKRDDAVKAYETAVNGPGSSPVAANNLAFIYAERGVNLDVALQLATTAKQRLPDDPSVNDTLGWVYYKKGQPALAVGPLQESLRARPDSPEVLFHLGMAYARLGDNTKAREALERAVKLDPKVGGDEARKTLASIPQ